VHRGNLDGYCDVSRYVVQNNMRLLQGIILSYQTMLLSKYETNVDGVCSKREYVLVEYNNAIFLSESVHYYIIIHT